MPDVRGTPGSQLRIDYERAIAANQANPNSETWRAIEQAQAAIDADRIRNLQQAKQEQSTPFSDALIAAETRKRLGPGFQHAFDPRLMHFLHSPDNRGVRGVYYPAELDEKYRDDMETQYYWQDPRTQNLSATRFQPQLDHLYQFGPQPEPKTMAHEFRHRAGVGDEYTNRRYDAAYAQNEGEWFDAVRMWDDYLSAIGFESAGRKPDLKSAEADLVDNLRRYKDKLLEQQYNAAPEGDKPYPSDPQEPSIGGFLRELLGEEPNSRAAFVRGTTLPYENLERIRDVVPMRETYDAIMQRNAEFEERDRQLELARRRAIEQQDKTKPTIRPLPSVFIQSSPSRDQK